MQPSEKEEGLPLLIWVCETCGEEWSLEPSVEPSRNALGRPTCARCLKGLPFAPLLAHIGVQPDTVIAEILGCSRKYVHRHRGNVVKLSDAERFADKLGVHPMLLWPEEYPAKTRSEED